MTPEIRCINTVAKEPKSFAPGLFCLMAQLKWSFGKSTITIIDNNYIQWSTIKFGMRRGERGRIICWSGIGFKIHKNAKIYEDSDISVSFLKIPNTNENTGCHKMFAFLKVLEDIFFVIILLYAYPDSDFYPNKSLKKIIIQRKMRILSFS